MYVRLPCKTKLKENSLSNKFTQNSMVSMITPLARVINIKLDEIHTSLLLFPRLELTKHEFPI